MDDEVFSKDNKKSFAGSKIVTAEVSIDWGLFCILYGHAGCGKTTLAAAAEDSEYGKPCVIMDAEGGVRSIAHRKQQVIKITKWDQVTNIIEALKSGKDCPWKTIIWDNASELQVKNMEKVNPSGDAPTQPQWGKNTIEMLQWIRDCRDIAQTRSINIIIIAWDSVEDDAGSKRRYIHFTPKLSEKAPGIVDIIGHITVQNNPPNFTRILSFSPSPKTDAKFRRAENEPAVDIPLQIPYGLANLPMGDLLDTLRGGKPWPKNKYKALSSTA